MWPRFSTPAPFNAFWKCKTFFGSADDHMIMVSENLAQFRSLNSEEDNQHIRLPPNIWYADAPRNGQNPLPFKSKMADGAQTGNG